MKIRTLGDLQNHLDSEFGWRIKEVSSLKVAVSSTPAPLQRTIIRAGVPLLYAHWEGFVKNACEVYVQFVSLQRLKLDELASNFVVFGAKKYISDLAVSQRAKRGIDVVEFFRTRMTERAEFDGKSAINTESNLSSRVFENIATSVGIDASRYESRYHFIDSSLLKRRNTIAHGEYLELTKESYKELADDVIMLLRWVKTDIENAASFTSYRK